MDLLEEDFIGAGGLIKRGDAIVIRHDLPVPHVLLVQRRDTNELALPGGFYDTNFDSDTVDTALRETVEETGVDIRGFKQKSHVVYQGPIADIRSTIHAWPETTAILVDLPTEVTQSLAVKIEGNAEVKKSEWYPIHDAPTALFGSHNLLLEIALRRLPRQHI